MADPDMPEADDVTILAGLHALRLLEGEELARAKRLLLSDASFAQAVTWWERHFATMSEESEAVQPSPSVRDALFARIENEGAGGADAHAGNVVPLGNRKAAPWSVGLAIFGSAMAAAALVLFLSTPTATPPTDAPVVASRTGPTLVAQIQSEDGAVRLAGVIDGASGQIAINASGLAPGQGRTAELWVIPEGGAPRSLGYLPDTGVLERALTGTEAGLLQAGATLAVTYEDDTGRPHDAPTMPIILAGAIDAV